MSCTVWKAKKSGRQEFSWKVLDTIVTCLVYVTRLWLLPACAAGLRHSYSTQKINIMLLGCFCMYLIQVKSVLSFITGLLAPPLSITLHTEASAIVNPRHAYAERVTVLGLCVCVSVCLSPLILALQGPITRFQWAHGVAVQWGAARMLAS